MKIRTLWLVPLALAAASALADTGELVPIRDVRDLFVPVGFDSRNDIVAVIDGYLPDPCHRLRTPSVTVDAASNKAIITPLAERYQGVCPDVTVPFQQVVSLGLLRAGNYSVELYDGAKKEALGVAQAKEKITSDDYLYAPIESASVVFTGGGKAKAILRGRLTSNCLQKDVIRVTDHTKTYEVLTILKVLEKDPQGNPCKEEERPFEWTAELPSQPAPGRHLLHVRSLEGQSVNLVFSNRQN